MKHYKLFFTLILSCFLSVAMFTESRAQIYTGDLTLTSQAEVDAFSYTEVTGNLIITGTNITNLNGLSSLTGVGVNLYVNSNPLLTNIDGLAGLTNVGNSINVIDNLVLENIDGLSGITQVTGNYTIHKNSALINIDGLSNLTSVTMRMVVTNNDVLTNIDGFSGLTSVGFLLWISDNMVLSQFCILYPSLSSGGIADVLITGNAANPTEEQIIAGGACLNIIYVCSSTSGSVGGVNFTDADILAFDPNNDTWSLFFDGSDVGITTDINGFHILATGDILLTYKKAKLIPGVGTINPSDIVKFSPTTGLFEYYFDGSDVGLSDASENIDAIGMLPGGNLIISTIGAFSANGLSGDGEDLSKFTGTLGANTSGIFSWYFDGSDVGLAGENIEGSWIDPVDGDIYIAVGNAFIVGGICGDESDIFSFSPTELGANTSGTFNRAWVGSANDFAGQNMNGLSLSGTNIGPAPSPGPCELIGDLELFVIGLGLPNGLENSLTSSLNNAISSLQKGNNGAAINKLEAFINKVEDQRGNKIDEADADELIAAAQAIIDLIQSGLEKSNIGETLASDDITPQSYSLDQNYPNPFNPSTVIRYAVPENARVSVVVYDVLGNQIAELVNGNVAAGYHEVVFEGSNIASGIYFYRLTAGSYTQINKMLLMK